MSPSGIENLYRLFSVLGTFLSISTALVALYVAITQSRTAARAAGWLLFAACAGNAALDVVQLLLALAGSALSSSLGANAYQWVYLCTSLAGGLTVVGLGTSLLLFRHSSRPASHDAA